MGVKMTLVIFERALSEVRANSEELSFSDLIRKSRDALGIKQYRAAEFIGISQQRLQNLETGYYRDLPSDNELTGLSKVYNIDIQLLGDKAKQHVCERILQRKVRVINDEEEM